jgi:hypothetical protein
LVKKTNRMPGRVGANGKNSSTNRSRFRMAEAVGVRRLPLSMTTRMPTMRFPGVRPPSRVSKRKK